MGKTQDAMVISHKTALWTPGLNKQEQLSQRVEILPLHNCNNRVMSRGQQQSPFHGTGDLLLHFCLCVTERLLQRGTSLLLLREFLTCPDQPLLELSTLVPLLCKILQVLLVHRLLMLQLLQRFVSGLLQPLQLLPLLLRSKLPVPQVASFACGPRTRCVVVPHLPLDQVAEVAQLVLLVHDLCHQTVSLGCGTRNLPLQLCQGLGPSVQQRTRRPPLLRV
mmetsp:Transcript_47786/g.78723  ORF Transcript_47786/g.78723 Transcript_47786/m.78723 type:complete len:221 (-) Transcript_47786:562-1224(-)